MKNTIPIIALSLFIFCCSSCKQSDSLFEKDQNDWVAGGDADWKHIDDMIVGSSDSLVGFLITNQEYTDFELELDFMVDSTVNSGVFIRCTNQAINPTDCYELNIWDLHPNQDYRTGALVTKAKPLAYIETLGKWNTYLIRCEDQHIQAWINGIKMVDMEDDHLLSGHIGIQAAEKGEVRFKNVVITEL